jgi:hypothetical protein
MALHTQLPIYRTGLELLTLAHRVQEQMPRGVKRTVGEKIAQHCTDILELMALANASREQRSQYLRELLTSNGCSDEYITNRELKEAEIPGLGVSARHMMQTLGTEWARHHLAEDFWLKLAATNMAHMRGHGYRNFVVSDVRFANEAEWVRTQGGEIWMLERPGLAPVRKHVSECVQFRVDQVLRNDGSLAKLEHTALDALASAKRFARAGREAA